jgi:DNA polymerase-3 subunit epsilon
MTTARDFLLQEHVFLDTETTGVDSDAEIVEIAIVDAAGNDLVNTLIRPTIKIPVEASNVHGITDHDVESAPTWLEVWPEIRSAIENRYVGIYNAEFDTRLIRQSHIKAGGEWEPLGSMVLCIMKLYAKFHGEWDSYYGSYTWQSLEDAGMQCGIDIPNTHRAKDDALLAREVLHCIAEGMDREL